MKTQLILAILLLTAILGGCTKGPGAQVVHRADRDIEVLRQIWPGSYSNYAQVIAQSAGNPVTDISIRQLQISGEPVFLFERQLRDKDVFDFDLYWLKLDHETRQPVLFFTRLAENELSLPIQETLSTAWQRVLPGCVMALERDGDHFFGRTSTDTCVFEDPLNGVTRLTRLITISADAMTIENGIQDPGSPETSTYTMLELQKNRGFNGWASIRLSSTGQADEMGEWQKSKSFYIRDDGRVTRLYDERMESMQFGLQLAKLHRFDGEPPYFVLSVINMQNGQTQGYQWFAPGSENLELNFDWFQAHLEAEPAKDPEP